MILGWVAKEDVQRVDRERVVRVVQRGGCPHQRRAEEGHPRKDAGQWAGFVLCQVP